MTQDVKQFPHDLEAEEIAVAALLQDGYLPGVLPHHFFNTEYRKIFLAIQRLKKDGGDINPVTVAAASGGDIMALSDLGRYPLIAGKHIVARLDEAHKRRKMFVLSAALEKAAYKKGDVDYDAVKEHLAALFTPKGAPWADRIETITNAELATPPPPQEYLLTKGDRGVLPCGKVGLLAAAGGVGKSWALLQLAVSVACGKRWFGLYHVESSKRGRVLLLAGEEDRQELLRRLHAIMDSTGADKVDKDLLSKNLCIAGLAGENPSLVGTDGSPTDAAESLYRSLERDEWRLILFDPLTRFAGYETEKDNFMGTLFVEVCERYTQLPGRPTVLVSHHTNKSDRKAKTGRGTDEAEATGTRGVTALTDGMRWVSKIAQIEAPEGWAYGPVYGFVIPKNNYSPGSQEVELLERKPINKGVLTVMEKDREAEWKELRKAAKIKKRGKTNGPSGDYSGDDPFSGPVPELVDLGRADYDER